MLDLGKIRAELATHTQALNMFLNLLSIGSQGKVERYMDSHGEELREIKHSLHWVTASMQASSHEEKSILTTYGEDDKAIWKAFRRELIEEGISSQVLDKHKRTIQKYVIELGERGALDEPAQEDDIQTSTLYSSDYLRTSSPPAGQELRSRSVEGEDTNIEDDDDASCGKDAVSHLIYLNSTLDPATTTAITENIKTEGKDRGVSSEGDSNKINEQECSVSPSKPPVETSSVSLERNICQEVKCDEVLLSNAPHTLSGQKNKSQHQPHQYNHSTYEELPERNASLSGEGQQNEQSLKAPGFAPHASVEDIEDEDFADGAHPNCEDSEDPGRYATNSRLNYDRSPQRRLSDIEKVTLPTSKNEIGPETTEPKPVFVTTTGKMRHVDAYESFYEGDDSSFEDTSSDESEISVSVNNRVDAEDMPRRYMLREQPIYKSESSGNTGFSVIVDPLKRQREYLMRQRDRRESYKAVGHNPKRPFEAPISDTYAEDFDLDTITWSAGRDMSERPMDSLPDSLVSEPDYLPAVAIAHHSRGNKEWDLDHPNSCPYHTEQFFCPERRQHSARNRSQSYAKIHYDSESVTTSSQESSDGESGEFPGPIDSSPSKVPKYMVDTEGTIHTVYFTRPEALKSPLGPQTSPGLEWNWDHMKQSPTTSQLADCGTASEGDQYQSGSESQIPLRNIPVRKRSIAKFCASLDQLNRNMNKTEKWLKESEHIDPGIRILSNDFLTGAENLADKIRVKFESIKNEPANDTYGMSFKYALRGVNSGRQRIADIYSSSVAFENQNFSDVIEPWTRRLDSAGP